MGSSWEFLWSAGSFVICFKCVCLTWFRVPLRWSLDCNYHTLLMDCLSVVNFDSMHRVLWCFRIIARNLLRESEFVIWINSLAWTPKNINDPDCHISLNNSMPVSCKEGVCFMFGSIFFYETGNVLSVFGFLMMGVSFLNWSFIHRETEGDIRGFSKLNRSEFFGFFLFLCSRIKLLNLLETWRYLGLLVIEARWGSMKV